MSDKKSVSLHEVLNSDVFDEDTYDLIAGRIFNNLKLYCMSKNYWDEANWFGSTNRSIHNFYVQKNWARLHWKIELYNLLDSMVQIVPRNGPNVSDDEMITQAISDFNGYPIAGRSIYTTLSFDF